MKILLAVDGSEYSKKMLAYLVTHEDLFTTAHDYHVFTAHPALPARARAIVGKDIVEKYYQEEPICDVQFNVCQRQMSKTKLSKH